MEVSIGGSVVTYAGKVKSEEVWLIIVTFYYSISFHNVGNVTGPAINEQQITYAGAGASMGGNW